MILFDKVVMSWYIITYPMELNCDISCHVLSCHSLFISSCMVIHHTLWSHHYRIIITYPMELNCDIMSCHYMSFIIYIIMYGDTLYIMITHHYRESSMLYSIRMERLENGGIMIFFIIIEIYQIEIEIEIDWI